MPEGRELERHSSPDKMLDAVVVERLTNAITATPIELFLVRSGNDWKGESPVFRGTELEGLEIVWPRTRYLEIRYKKGRVFQFANFWNSKDVQDFKYTVELRLVPELTPSLPE